MSRRSDAPLLGLALDSQASEPLHRQIHAALRDAVLAGNLTPGRRLPSTRALAAELGCARNTVLGAYEQLQSEGYLETRAGSGCWVSPILPDDLGRPQGHAGKRRSPAGPPPRLSTRGRALLAPQRAPRREGPAPFALGEPDLEGFPFDQWGRVLGSIWRRPDPDLLADRDPAGHRPLREALARHLNAVRGLRCSADEVVITNGSQQGVDLVARLLLDAGDGAWIEDPGYTGLRGPLEAAELEPIPIGVDDDGLQVDTALADPDAARLAIVAPSRQFPLGATLALPRRLALLDWAHAHDGWVLEDDYDSEYRYAGRPLTALRGLDAERRPGAERVVYLGSFSKVMFPGLRLGYLVVPRALAPEIVAARRALDAQPSIIVQPAMARFIDSGRFAAHVRRMRVRYAARQQRLLDAAARHLNGLLAVRGDDAGMHLVGRPAAGLPDDVALSKRAARAGLDVAPLSAFSLRRPAPQGLLLGYAAMADADIEPAVRLLARTLAAAKRSTRAGVRGS